MADAVMLAGKLQGFAKEVSQLAEQVATLDATPPALANAIGALVMTPLPLCPTRLSPIDVATATAAVMKVPVGQLLSRCRTQHVSFVRQMAMYLWLREMTGKSFPLIGETFGRDHSTVIHAHNLIGKRLRMPDEGAAGIRFIIDAVEAFLHLQGVTRRAQIAQIQSRQQQSAAA